EFHAALDTLFATLSEMQPWHVFCINPNDSQLPNQLEGRTTNLTAVATRCGGGDPEKGAVRAWEAGMMMGQFVERYGGEESVWG
ncbi:hypothetical protein B0H16DRAFT_1248028, partial [Mycena metata]